MNYLQQEIINLEIKTLSPVAILNESNAKLSPYIDIVRDKDEFALLDVDKIADKLINDEKYYNKYLQILRNKSSNSIDKYTIKNLLDDKNIKLKDIEAGRIKAKCSVRGNNEIDTCIKSRGIAYIPGSTIKGSIRTAMLYNKMNKEKLREKTYFGREYVGQDVFRKNPKSIQEDMFKDLIIRDTYLSSDIETCVYEARSINLYKSIGAYKLNLDMPILLESIEKEQVLNSQIVMKNKRFSKEELFSNINDFFEKVINKELEEINKLKFNGKNILINQYNQLLNKIIDFKEEKNGFICRVGKLKGFFSNTLTAGLNNDEVYNLMKNLNDGKRKKIKMRKTKGEFPTTKWVISSDKSIEGTFGWIEVREK